MDLVSLREHIKTDDIYTTAAFQCRDIYWCISATNFFAVE